MISSELSVWNSVLDLASSDNSMKQCITDSPHSGIICVDQDINKPARSSHRKSEEER